MSNAGWDNYEFRWGGTVRGVCYKAEPRFGNIGGTWRSLTGDDLAVMMHAKDADTLRRVADAMDGQDSLGGDYHEGWEEGYKAGRDWEKRRQKGLGRIRELAALRRNNHATPASIVTVYWSDGVRVEWNEETGAVRVLPDGNWLYPAMTVSAQTREPDDELQWAVYRDGTPFVGYPKRDEAGGFHVVSVASDWVVQDIVEKVEQAKSGLPSDNLSDDWIRHDGEWCQACGRPYTTIYRVPDYVWSLISPRIGGGLLCVDCSWQRAYKEGITLYFEGKVDGWEDASACDLSEHGDWIRHNGGECPVHPLDVVEVKFKSGIKAMEGPNKAGAWEWNWIGHLSDIAYYRPLRDEDGIPYVYNDDTLEDWAEYVATDEDGDINQFATKPCLGVQSWFFSGDGFLAPSQYRNTLVHWTNTLRRVWK